jgi:hypothetical protein
MGNLFLNLILGTISSILGAVLLNKFTYNSNSPSKFIKTGIPAIVIGLLVFWLLYNLHPVSVEYVECCLGQDGELYVRGKVVNSVLLSPVSGKSIQTKVFHEGDSTPIAGPENGVSNFEGIFKAKFKSPDLTKPYLINSACKCKTIIGEKWIIKDFSMGVTLKCE